MTKQPTLKRTNWIWKWLFLVYLHPGWRHYVLVRNPYDRVISFYKNKIETVDPELVARYGWQDCQKLFFPSAGIQPNHKFEEIRDLLARISFPGFVTLLPEMFSLDAHLVPQSDLLYKHIRTPPMKLRLPVDRLLRMETDLWILWDQLGLEAAIHENPNPGTRFADYFDGPSYKIVSQVYSDDFLNFGYAKMTPDNGSVAE